ncbi:MAG: repeat-containing protein [Bacteroidetes bacterium]|nr:repeat-containing protein [Bacteroidota bacterium]
MKRFILFFLCISLLPQRYRSQSMTWSTTTLYNDGNKHSCRDASGNIYLFQSQDTIKKINSFGNVLSQMTLPANMTISNLVATPDTGFYVCGNYTGTLAIGGNTYNSNGLTDIWFARYNKIGMLIWCKSFGSKGEDYSGDICVTPSGFVITGALSDTLIYMGQTYPKVKQTELFVATFNDNGGLLASKFAVSTNLQGTQGSSTQSVAVSAGNECEVDAAGNIYVLTHSYGASKIDSFTIGNWVNPQNPYQPSTKTIIKLNPALQTQFKSFYSQYANSSLFFDNLAVSPAGDSYVVDHYQNGQSGGDIQWSTLYHINTSGSMAGSFALRPDKRSDISDLEIDQCGNIYLTGYWRDYWYSHPFYNASFVAQLSPQFTLSWILNDSTQSSFSRGVSLCLLDSNQFFMSGYILDTVTDAFGVYPGPNKTGFFTKIIGPSSYACLNAVGLPENAKNNLAFSIFPNPSSGKFYLSDDAIGSELKLFNSQGLLLRDEKKIGKEISLFEFPEGVYFIRLTDATGRSNVGKLVLMK